MIADDDPRHGTANGYTNLHCRCDRCRVANTAYIRGRQTGPYRKDPCPLCGQPKHFRAVLCRDCRYALETAPHGTESRYKDCRCDICREAAAVGRQRRRLAAL